MGRPFEKNDKRINRRGRPKRGQALSDILNYKLDQVDTCGKLRREVVAEKLIEVALAGDIAALRYIFDRTCGKPRESVELTGGAVDKRLLEILNNDRT